MSIGDEHNLEIKKTIIIDVSSEVVFKAITESEELTQWFPDQAISTKNWRKGEICYT